MSTRPDFIIKTDSTDPVYSVQLRTRSTQNEPGSEPVDLTNADTVEFLMPIPDEDGMVREDATIVDAESGDVEVRLPSGIGDGDYDAEFRVDFEDGETLFWPQHHNLLVAVRAGTNRELDPADLSDPDASVTTLFVDELEANTGESISVASDTDHNGNDVSNVGALYTDELSITDTLLDSGSAFDTVGAITPTVNPSSTTSTSYEEIVNRNDTVGAFSGNRIPDGASLYGNFVVRTSSVSDGETGFYRPSVILQSDGDVSGDGLDELEIEVTSSGTRTSGWQEITTFDASDAEIMTASGIEGKVTDGTLDPDAQRFFGVVFEWRVD